MSERTLAGKPGPTTFHTYVALAGTTSPMVGEVELSDSVLLSLVHGAWLRYRIILGLAGLLVLGLAILSFREPTATMGTGVPFYPTSLPRGYALIDLDEQAKLEQGSANAKARVAHVEAKLQESEEARRMIEGQLQRALSAIATRKATAKGIEPVFPRPTAPSPVGRRPAALVPQPVPTEIPTIGPPARSDVPEPEPLVAEPAVIRKRARPKAKPEPVVVAVPAPEAPVQTPEPIVVPEPEPVEARTPEPDDAREPEPSAAGPAESVLYLPEIDRGFVLRVPDTAADADDESAVDVLERLVEPAPEHTNDLDPSVVRQRLTRLAASKKPGPRHDDQPGGPKSGPKSGPSGPKSGSKA